MNRLLSCLDALLEAWNELKVQQEEGGGGGEQQIGRKMDFQKEKLFLANVRGRNRALPIKFNPGMQIYTQR